MNEELIEIVFKFAFELGVNEGAFSERYSYVPSRAYEAWENITNNPNFNPVDIDDWKTLQ